jgi:RHH-type rel operon transcriptional repressor/antitoxin RelB
MHRFERNAMPTTIDLDPEVEERLNIFAERIGRSKELCLRQFVEDGLADVEEYCRAAEVLERVKRGEEKTYSAEDVRKSLGLDN